MRYRPDETPVEQKSYSGFFFLLGVVSLLVAGWVTFNEFQTRRPWKKYQSDFYELERVRLKAAIDDLEAELESLGVDPGDIDQIVALDTSLSPREIDALVRETMVSTYGSVEAFNAAWAKIDITEGGGKVAHEVVDRGFTDAFWHNELTLADLERMYHEEDGKLRIQSARRDAEYYEYSTDRDAESEKRRFERADRFMNERIQGRDAAIAALRGATDTMRLWLADFQKAKGAAQTRKEQEGLQGYSGEVIALAKDLDAARDQLGLVQYNLIGLLTQFKEAKRPQIRQVILGEVAHETNNVDRCATCHIVADKDGYDMWISDAASVLDTGALVKATPVPDRLGTFTPNPARVVGDLSELVLSRPAQKGKLWSEPLVYINGVRVYPEQGFRVSGWTVRWDTEFAQAQLTGGAVIEVLQAYPKLYQSHPHREALFTAHPNEKFACITCHDGQGRALTWTDAGCDFRENPDSPSSPMFYWEAPVLSNASKLDGAIEAAKAVLPQQALAEIARYLHVPVSVVVRHEASLDTDWSYRRTSHFHPKVNGEPLGSFAEAKCRSCHNEALELDYAPTLSKAKRLFEKLGCGGCHLVADYERLLYDPQVDYVEYRRAQVGPSLTWDARLAAASQSPPGVPNRGIGWKLNEKTGQQWMVNWLKNPRSYLHDTRMPSYRLSDAEAKALTAFLLAPTGWGSSMSSSPLASAGEAGGFQLVADTSATSSADVPINPDNVRKGELLVVNTGCLACHQIRDSQTGTMRGNTFGPNLSMAGSKLSRKFLEQWLENPRTYDPKTIMPAMFDNVSPTERRDQIRAITDYLLAQNDTSWMRSSESFEITPKLIEQGERIFGPSGKGCVGCHYFEADMPDGSGGTRKVGGAAWLGQQIGPELTDFGIKKPEVLDFGFAKHREIAYFGDRNALLWGELLRENEDGSIVVRTVANQADPNAAKGFFYKKGEDLTEVSIAADMPRSVTKVENTWHDWAFNKIKEPNLYATEVNSIAQNMPNFYLSDDEAAALLVLLKSFKGGSHVPEAYRDHLTTREKRIERGRMLVTRYNCVGCHVVEESIATVDGRLIKGWEIGKHVLDDPLLPAVPGPDGILGTDDDVRGGWAVPVSPFGAMTNVRMSYDPARPNEDVQKSQISLPAEALELRNPSGTFVGFHSVGSPLSFMRGGYMYEANGHRVQVQHGPVLTFAGKRFRPEWLFDFIKRPYPVRQYLFMQGQSRMPLYHLTDSEVSDIVAYLMALVDEPYPYESIIPSPQADLVAMGKTMFLNEARCASGACHPSTAPKPENRAPDLASTARLKPTWVKEWIANPEAFWPGNGMPYFPWDLGGSAIYPQYADGNVDTQMNALRDYVLALGKPRQR